MNGDVDFIARIVMVYRGDEMFDLHGRFERKMNGSFFVVHYLSVIRLDSAPGPSIVSTDFCVLVEIVSGASGPNHKVYAASILVISSPKVAA